MEVRSLEAKKKELGILLTEARHIESPEQKDKRYTTVEQTFETLSAKDSSLNESQKAVIE